MNPNDKAVLEALEDMVWQFAYRSSRGKRAVLHTGGLSALEGAFDALGWPDPKVVTDDTGCLCDVKGCCGFIVAQGCAWPDTGYWCVCADHSDAARKGEPQPTMKTRAVKREKKRVKP